MGLAFFENVKAALEAERVLAAAGYTVRLVAPPAEMRMGCDLALEVDMVEQVGMERALRARGIRLVGTVPLAGGTVPMLDVVKITDFGRWTMVKAGNMKLTFEKGSGLIVNVSGGGCPDIPYLNVELVGKGLTEAPRPADAGYTLCARMLDLALQECLHMHEDGKQPCC